MWKSEVTEQDYARYQKLCESGVGQYVAGLLLQGFHWKSSKKDVLNVKVNNIKRRVDKNFLK